ncbi:putative F-box protein [Acorus calamus]|uniref:F-box protein n=1 Tax=Acorus calamus TaxID=4465 RepID=A0AAV9D6L4_ACOCL|nr:putative F-box protein [Acorus calamus]
MMMIKKIEDDDDDNNKNKVIIHWSELCTDMLNLIASYLATPRDYMSFRRVCKSWRSLTPPLSRLPWLLLHDDPPTTGLRRFYSPLEAGDKTWICLDMDYNGPFEDAVFFKDRLLAVCELGYITEFDIGEQDEDSTNWDDVKSVRQPKDEEIFEEQHFILASPDGSQEESRRWTMLDNNTDHGRQWVRLEGLGDEALFLGKNESRSIIVADDDSLHGLRKNCIYFTESEHGYYTGNTVDPHWDLDMGVYSLENRSVSDYIISKKPYLIGGGKSVWESPPIWLN